MITKRKLISAISLCASVDFPGIAHASSFAAEIIGSSTPIVANGGSSTDILGAPDGFWVEFGSETGLGFTTVGFGGTVLDGPGVDFIIHLYDFAGNRDGFEFLVSETGASFISLGTFVPTPLTEQGNVSIDLFGSGLTNITQIQIMNITTEASAGPEIDAIEALYSQPSTVPVPAASWLFGSGLIGLIGITRKRMH